MRVRSGMFTGQIRTLGVMCSQSHYLSLMKQSLETKQKINIAFQNQLLVVFVFIPSTCCKKLNCSQKASSFKPLSVSSFILVSSSLHVIYSSSPPSTTPPPPTPPFPFSDTIVSCCDCCWQSAVRCCGHHAVSADGWSLHVLPVSPRCGHH